MKRMPTSVLVILFFTFQVVTGQERLVGLDNNPHVTKEKSSKRLKATGPTGLISLPFFDDFASTEVLPDDRWWQDNHVYINNTYGINPVTIGVATFDAIDENGFLYENASADTFQADYLTSRPIDLSEPGLINVYLSFYYQPKGNGQQPETEDSLFVDFKGPKDTVWQKIWSVPGVESGISEFTRVVLPVNNPAWLDTGFQFRFRNYASLGSINFDPGRVDNDDHWNIDFVYLDANRDPQAESFEDVAFTTIYDSIMNKYSSVPWRHWPVAADSEFKGKIVADIKNFFNVSRTIDLDYFQYDFLSDYFVKKNTRVTEIPPGQTHTFLPLPDQFPSNGNDSARFILTSYLSIDTVSARSIYRWNDTTQITYQFYDYYAYDDGSAENGYGISGQGTQDAMVAYRFESYMEDTLTGVYIYFNKVLNDQNVRDFRLAVWTDEEDSPGQMIYRTEDTTFRPEFNHLNSFVYYPLDTYLVVDDKFYLGWQQLSPDFMNVGWDVNRRASGSLFYYLNGRWNPSTFSGALMMRPVFGTKSRPTSVSRAKKLNPAITFYPNPAHDILYWNIDNNNYHVSTFNIFDISGKIVNNPARFSHEKGEVDVSRLKQGIYFVRVIFEDGTSYSGKFLKY
ncbi:MAG: T9SS type A sorting domain-containing protein [Bacteroidales bacterium]